MPLQSEFSESVLNQETNLTEPMYSLPQCLIHKTFICDLIQQVLPKPTIKTSSNQQQTAPRKQRVNWSTQEEKYLKEGVTLLGTGQWRHILAAYPFHPSRNGDNLRDKYRNSILPGMKKVKKTLSTVI